MLDRYMTPKEWQQFNHQKKIDEMYSQCKVYCKCGHSMPIRPMIDRVICSYCHKWVYRTPEIEQKYKQEDFERKLKKFLKSTEKIEKGKRNERIRKRK